MTVRPMNVLGFFAALACLIGSIGNAAHASDPQLLKPTLRLVHRGLAGPDRGLPLAQMLWPVRPLCRPSEGLWDSPERPVLTAMASPETGPQCRGDVASQDFHRGDGRTPARPGPGGHAMTPFGWQARPAKIACGHPMSARST